MTRVVFHVGLPKTGSTTLQEKVFPVLHGVDYLGRKGAEGRDAQRVAAARAIIFALRHRTPEVREDGVHPNLPRFRDWVMGLGGTVLFSEEGLSSNTEARATGFDRIPLMPEAIRHLFPDAAIVLVLREPHEWIASMMLQRMHDGPTRAVDRQGKAYPLMPRRFIDWHFELLARGDISSILVSGARLDRMVAGYRATFPPERVHVLAFERLFGPDEGWRAAFARILGVPVDMPPPPRLNESSDARRRAIAARFYDDEDRIARFVQGWRDAPDVLRAHPAFQDYVGRHCLPVWREAMAA
jgi:hypothetical protein